VATRSFAAARAGPRAGRRGCGGGAVRRSGGGSGARRAPVAQMLRTCIVKKVAPRLAARRQELCCLFTWVVGMRGHGVGGGALSGSGGAQGRTGATGHGVRLAFALRSRAGGSQPTALTKMW
jgi:hypothetical protein